MFSDVLSQSILAHIQTILNPIIFTLQCIWELVKCLDILHASKKFLGSSQVLKFEIIPRLPSSYNDVSHLLVHILNSSRKVRRKTIQNSLEQRYSASPGLSFGSSPHQR